MIKRKPKQRKFKVTMTMWRETWSGHDQKDGKLEVVVTARYPSEAKKKGVRQQLNPGRGRSWSHSIWATDVSVEEV